MPAERAYVPVMPPAAPLTAEAARVDCRSAAAHGPQLSPRRQRDLRDGRRCARWRGRAPWVFLLPRVHPV